MARELIKNESFQIIGSLEDVGNKIIAKDFYGRIVAHGDITSALIWQEYGKRPF